jgi:hypothetical protein
MPATKPRAYQVYDIDWKQAVRALSDSNINLASPGALVIDAVVLDPYDRVLLTAQTNAVENGIYQVNAAQTLLVPAPDWVNINSGLSSAVNSGLTVTITQGAQYAQTNWTLTTPNPILIGITAIEFEQLPEASDRIGNIYFDGSTIELANSAPETDISIRPSGAGSDVGIVIPDDATANVDALHIFNTVTNGNVKISTAGGDWVYYANNNITGTGVVSAGYFVGDGSLLTNINGSNVIGGYGNSNVAAYLPTYTGNLVSLTGNVTTTANVSASYILGNGSQLTGLPASYSNANVAAYLPTYTGNITGNFITLTGNISASNAITSTGVYTTELEAASASINELYVNSNIFADGLLVNTNTGITANGGNITINRLSGNGGYLNAVGANLSGNLTLGNIVGNLTVDGNIRLDQNIITDSASIISNPGFLGIYVDKTDLYDGMHFYPSLVEIFNSALVSIITNAGSNTNSYTWTFDNTGNLALPRNTSNINYANGINILDGYATVSSQYLSNATSQSYNDFVTGNYYNASTLDIDYTAYTGASLLNFDIAYQAPLTANIGISVGAVNTPLIQANANIVLTANSGTAQTWRFGTDGNLTLPGDLVIAGNTSVFGTNRALIQPDDDLPLLALSSGANGAVSSIWVEDIGNIGTSNIAAVYANPTVGSKIVRIVVGQNGVGSGPNLWDFDTTGNLTTPRGMVINGNINFLGTDTALLNPADNTPLSLFTSGTNGTVTSFWAQDVGNLMSSNIAAFYLPLQGTQTVRIVNGTNGGNIAIYDFDKDGVFSTTQVSATGNVSADYLVVSGGIRATGASPAPSLSGFSSISTVSATGNITASGNLIANVGIITTGNITGNTAGFAIGYRDLPQVSFTGDATLAATDAGKHYYSTLATANTLTIANNSSVSWSVGTAITVVNRGSGNITIAQGTGVSLYLAGNSTAANRTITSYGMATLLNVAANVWMINGTGVS